MNKFFIGLDFSKLTVDVSIVSKVKPEELIAYRQFKNTSAGVKSLITWASKELKVDLKSEVIFCGEKTGTYSRLFSNTLADAGYFIWLQHAMHIKLGMGDVKGKDDKTDSKRIATYAARFEDKAVRYARPQDRTRLLQSLLSQRHILMENLKSFSVNRKENCADLLNLEIAKEICEKYEEIENRLKEQIKELDKLIKKAIQESEEYIQTYNLLTSVKGVALQNAAAFIVFTDNFKRFDFDYRKIATYWGVVPFKNESGTSVKLGTHVSPKSNSWLKALITEAALCAVRFDEYIGHYYRRLIERGKPKGIALNNTKNKLIKILVALVRDNKSYDPNYNLKKTNKAA